MLLKCYSLTGHVSLFVFLLDFFVFIAIASPAQQTLFETFLKNLQATVEGVGRYDIGMGSEPTIGQFKGHAMIITDFVHRLEADHEQCSCLVDTHGGEQPAEICDMIDRLNNGKTDPEEFINTFLFYGPPGTGKTTLAKTIAEKTGSELIIIMISAAVKPNQGSGPEEIENKFRQVEKILAGNKHDEVEETFSDDKADEKKILPESNTNTVIVFIDEIDSAARARDKDGKYFDLTNTFLTLTQYVDKYRNKNSRVLIIAATNKPEFLDGAFSSRFKNVEIGYPDRLQILSIFNHYLKKYQHTLSDDQLKNFAHQAYEAHLCGRNIMDVVLEAHWQAVKDNKGLIIAKHMEMPLYKQAKKRKKEDAQIQQEIDDKERDRKLREEQLDQVRYDKSRRQTREELEKQQLRQAKWSPYSIPGRVAGHMAGD